MSGKRTYTVPILLLIATVLATLIVILLSRLLIDGQADKLDKGKRLAEGYNDCLAYAGILKDDARALSGTAAAVDRLAVKERIGQVPPVSSACGKTLSESGVQSGQTQEEAESAVSAAMQTIWSKLEPIGNHDGPLTQDELDTLQKIGDAGEKLETTLKQYEVPTGDDRFRQMEAGIDWVGPAGQTVKQLQDLASALNAK
ncbi:hypothetical protein [Cohnella zeiphila]|uniref:Uncharacterized protein n=1 Tax=Cohnella zeiphila TaxID=2761120 RepID=A0A7X0SGV5_9BACL|nr:hypothetical protein [Cohnella zeiphila]MBB6729718.1 hypothetical protein [Cohnella zeiphila]